MVSYDLVAYIIPLGMSVIRPYSNTEVWRVFEFSMSLSLWDDAVPYALFVLNSI
jgi:hypothetical protein